MFASLVTQTCKKAVINNFRSPARTRHGSWYLDVTLDMTFTSTWSWKVPRKVANNKQFTTEINQFYLESWPDEFRTTNCFCTVLLHWGICLSILQRSTHARKVNTALKETCHCITGCIKSTNTDIFYVIVGSEIRQAAENDKQKKQKHKMNPMTSCLSYYHDGHPFHLTYSFRDTI